MNQKNEDVNVIFLDAGGVLFDTFIKKEDRIRRLLMGRGYQLADIDTAIIKAKKITPFFYMTNWDEEQQYSEDFFGNIAKELGNTELTNELVYFGHYARHCELFPEVKETLEALSGKYRLGVISNASPSMDWIFDWLGIRQYFEAIILSAFVNVGKPDEAIYRIALDQLNAGKEECVFIDDKLENTEAANHVGIKGLHLDREQLTLLELLKKHGLF